MKNISISNTSMAPFNPNGYPIIVWDSDNGQGYVVLLEGRSYDEIKEYTKTDEGLAWLYEFMKGVEDGNNHTDN